MRISCLAKWFMNKNLDLQSGDNDDNRKLNKLLYFSHLMYYAVTGEHLTPDKFEKTEKGLISREVYEKYKNSCLDPYIESDIEIDNETALKILQIVNYVYSSKSIDDLSKETHSHSVWIEADVNKHIELKNLNDEERCLMKNIYDIYKDMDFDHICMKKIGDSIYYYDKRNIEMTDDIVSKLEKLNYPNEAMFVEDIDGELVLS